MAEKDNDKVVLGAVWPPLKTPLTLTKLQIAERQLEVASRLHLAGQDYLAVLTLAGAAEEILGHLIRRYKEDKHSMMDRIVELDRELTGGRSSKEVSAEVNRARNSLKHARNPKEDRAVAIEPGEATAMLLRALVNYSRLTGNLTEVMGRARDKLVKEMDD